MKKFCVSFFVLFLISCSQDSVQSEVAVKKFNWSMVTTWPKNYPGLGMAPERFSNVVNEMSQGQLKITVYGAGEFVPAMGVFDAVSSGSVEMGHGGAYYWKGKVPAAQFFAGVPFGFTADEIRPRASVSVPYKRTSQSSPKDFKEEDGIALGQKVLHPKFGQGIVLNYEGSGESARVQINFESAGTKWLVLSFANLEVI